MFLSIYCVNYNFLLAPNENTFVIPTITNYYIMVAVLQKPLDVFDFSLKLIYLLKWCRRKIFVF